MKKCLIALTVALISVMAVMAQPAPKTYADEEYYVQINERNFEDENFRKFLLNTVDTDHDTYISTSEFAAVKKMDCSMRSIKSLQGIENFTELVELDCDINNLQRLDLSGNPKLTVLHCNSNKLNYLNVTQNTNLKRLYCSYNKLEEIDVRNNKLLRDFYCANNSLTKLYLRETSGLERLICSYNQLTSIDVTQNAKLFDLSCEGNKISGLDLSQNPKLDQLHCENNLIATLDISKNPLLCYVSCYNNPFTKLDISHCPILVDYVTNYEKTTSTESDYIDGQYIYTESKTYLKSTQSSICVSLEHQLIYSIPEKVTGLSAASAGKNKVTLTWDAAEKAEGYLVYAQKDGKYGYVGMTTFGTTFTDTNALDTDYNYYWVFGYSRDDCGNMIPGACEKYVYAKGVTLAVTNLKASSLTSGVKLSWTASAGAEGYLVYGIRPGGSYGYIGMTTKGTTYTDTKASKTDYTFYWVFPYHKAADGSMIVGGTAKYTYGRAK